MKTGGLHLRLVFVRYGGIQGGAIGHRKKDRPVALGTEEMGVGQVIAFKQTEQTGWVF
jgi:hypothetical protein